MRPRRQPDRAPPSGRSSPARTPSSRSRGPAGPPGGFRATAWVVLAVVVFATAMGFTVYLAQEQSRLGEGEAARRARDVRRQDALSYREAGSPGEATGAAAALSAPSSGSERGAPAPEGNRLPALRPPAAPGGQGPGELAAGPLAGGGSRPPQPLALPDPDLPPGTYNPLVDPLRGSVPVDPARMLDRAGSAAPAGPAEAGSEAEAALPARNHLVTLVLSGEIGPVALDPADAQTWGRIGYFLQRETRSFALVAPGGFVPLVAKVDPAGKVELEGGVPPGSSSRPEGDVAAPAYRLVISAASGSSGALTFYGQSLGSKYHSKIECRVEEIRGGKVKALTRFEIFEKITSAEKQGDYARYTRQVYDLALEKLVKTLRTLPLFREERRAK